MQFGAPLGTYTAADFTQDDAWFQIDVAPVRVDILMSIPGVSFEEAWVRRVDDEFLGVSAHYISRGDLMFAKQAAGRPQDKRDLKRLSKPPRTSRD